MKATQQEQARIENIASEVAKAHGYENVTAEFVVFKGFKVQWTRTYKTIGFRVSDYLCGAPYEVVKDVFEVILLRIEGKYKEYSKKTCDFFTDKHFSGAHRRTFNARNGIEPAKFKTFKGVPVHFYKDPQFKASGSSTLMRVIAIDPKFKEGSEEVLDNIIRYEYNLLQSGLSNFGREPQRVECDEELIKEYI